MQNAVDKHLETLGASARTNVGPVQAYFPKMTWPVRMREARWLRKGKHVDEGGILFKVMLLQAPQVGVRQETNIHCRPRAARRSKALQNKSGRGFEEAAAFGWDRTLGHYERL